MLIRTTRWLGALLVLSGFANAAVVLDRIAVIVGRQAIKTSDIEREMRVTSFLNQQPVDRSEDARRKVAERLIDQELVRRDMVRAQYSLPTEKDVTEFLERLKRDRFHGSDTDLRNQLTRYQLTEEQLRRHLLWEMTVLRFIDQRFRAAVLVTDEDIAAYRRENLAELQKKYPQAKTEDAMAQQIRELLTGDRVNQAFEQWLTDERRDTRIEYRPQAAGRGAAQ
jgi:hypothetical protein